MFLKEIIMLIAHQSLFDLDQKYSKQ